MKTIQYDRLDMQVDESERIRNREKKQASSVPSKPEEEKLEVAEKPVEKPTNVIDDQLNELLEEINTEETTEEEPVEVTETAQPESVVVAPEISFPEAINMELSQTSISQLQSMIDGLTSVIERSIEVQMEPQEIKVSLEQETIDSLTSTLMERFEQIYRRYQTAERPVETKSSSPPQEAPVDAELLAKITAVVDNVLDSKLDRFNPPKDDNLSEESIEQIVTLLASRMDKPQANPAEAPRETVTNPDLSPKVEQVRPEFTAPAQAAPAQPSYIIDNHCSQCGNMLQKHHKFCQECGSPRA